MLFPIPYIKYTFLVISLIFDYCYMDHIHVILFQTAGPTEGFEGGTCKATGMAKSKHPLFHLKVIIM